MFHQKITSNQEMGSTVVTDGKGGLKVWLNPLETRNEILKMRAYKEDIRFYEDVLGAKGINKNDKIVLKQEIKRSENSFLYYKKEYIKLLSIICLFLLGCQSSEVGSKYLEVKAKYEKNNYLSLEVRNISNYNIKFYRKSLNPPLLNVRINVEGKDIDGFYPLINDKSLITLKPKEKYFHTVNLDEIFPNIRKKHINKAISTIYWSLSIVPLSVDNKKVLLKDHDLYRLVFSGELSKKANK
jgi:hypothetical protein